MSQIFLINSVLVLSVTQGSGSGLSDLIQKWQIMPFNSMPLKMLSDMWLQYLIVKFQYHISRFIC